MTQTQTQSAAREEATLSFKRYILEQSDAYASEPAADLYRVNLLGRMLNRYDELLDEDISEGACILRVKAEFADIPEQMREQGFELAREGEQGKGKKDKRSMLERWPRLSEDDAARYIKESSDRNHKTAMGTALCSACVFPLMITCGLSEMIGGEDVLMMFGMVGMFAMIGIGCYLFSLAKKPRDREKIKKGRFSLSAGMRAKLRELRELTQEKARRRRAKGIALLVTCAVPIFVGAAMSELFWSTDGAFPIFGVAGMFAMIGAGVYEVMMGESEKKVMKDLLKEKE